MWNMIDKNTSTKHIYWKYKTRKLGLITTRKAKFELKFVIRKQTKTKITHRLTSAVLFYLL